ncbi:hypothetical protein XENOCAPTIV_010460 [Xenoophorus captivus]|uniref:Methyltransferase type 11 domain-containing protein n=1 Tax=Xenoophorus captivus TaxID=1517983 RepID=A0ABV0RJD6_9TELE
MIQLTGSMVSWEKTPSQFKLAVDVGCGPGQGTVLLAPYFTKVVGTDISQAMVERALAKSNPPNISYRICYAVKELPFTSGQVDLVTAMTAAHWFDQPRFLQEANRVLRPGGCLALLSYTMDMNLEYGDVSDTLNDICQEVHSKSWHLTIIVFMKDSLVYKHVKIKTFLQLAFL